MSQQYYNVSGATRQHDGHGRAGAADRVGRAVRWLRGIVEVGLIVAAVVGLALMLSGRARAAPEPEPEPEPAPMYVIILKYAAWAAAFETTGKHCGVQRFLDMAARISVMPLVEKVAAREADYVRTAVNTHMGIRHYYGCKVAVPLLDGEYEKFDRWVPTWPKLDP